MSVVAILLLAVCGWQDAAVPDLGTRKAGVDWPGFLGPDHDSKSPEKGIQWPPRALWRRNLGTSYGICSIYRGRAFQFDRSGKNAVLHCLKSETGEALWKFEYPSEYDDMYGYEPGPRCCPVLDGDRVYILGVEGMLHCLRVADGQPVWKKDTTRDFGVQQNFFGVGSTPIVEGELLIVQVGGSPAGSPGIQSGEVKGNGSGIVAFDKRTGEVKYKITDELASYASPLVTTINGRRWGFVFARGGLVGFEPATGKLDFQYAWRARILESVNASNPVVAGDLVLISECYGVGGSVLKVKPGGADVVWSDGRKRDPSLATHWNTPVHLDGYVYGSSGRHTADAELKCVELATGKVQWSTPRLTRSSLLYVDGHFICLGEDGALRLLKADPRQYEEVSKVVLKSPDGEPLLKYPAWAAPILSHGLLYVRGKDQLVCLELIPAK
ncbi:MAG: PQQ-like beta-propeller repeat protein [Planctomycetes bacterium]|nr:PQQ-like beta-propeller repeat protein [Planctomycetota bacterium]